MIKTLDKLGINEMNLNTITATYKKHTTNRQVKRMLGRQYFKKEKDNKCWQGCGEKLAFTHCWKTTCKFLKRIKNRNKARCFLSYVEDRSKK
jgi:hypothetical protein